MKITFLTLSLLLVWSVTPGIAAESEESPNPIDLLASRSLDDWFFYHDNERVKKEDVLSFLEDGILLSTNRPLGYFATKEEKTP